MRLVVTAVAALGAAFSSGSTAFAGGPALAPRPPAGLTAALGERSRVHLAWVASKGEVEVARYEVLRGEQVVVTARGTRADTAGPGRGRRYCYTVRAVGASGRRSQRSNLACVTRDVTPPTAPTSLAAAAGRPGEVALRWEPATDDVAIAEYAVLRGGRVVARTADTAATESGLRAAAEYCYAVVAVDVAGNASKPSATACATPPDVTAPTPPLGFAIEAPPGPSVVLSWAASSDDVGVAGYEVLRDGTVVATVNGTRAVDGRDAQAERCYTIRAFDAAGNRSEASDEACVESPDQVARGPANLHAEATSEHEVVLHWDPPARGAAAYVVYWERDGDRRVATTPLTALKVFGQAARERHCYRVAAQDEQERESSKTAPVCTSALIALSAR